MAVAGVSLFIIGLVGLLAMWYLRTSEERRGMRFFATRRERWDHATKGAYDVAVAGDVGRTLRSRFVILMHTLSHQTLTALVHLLRAIERPIARISHRMRMAPPTPPSPREPSEFLKTITPEKKDGEPTPPAV